MLCLLSDKAWNDLHQRHSIMIDVSSVADCAIIRVF
jgi:hypothetical protein